MIVMLCEFLITVVIFLEVLVCILHFLKNLAGIPLGPSSSE